MVKKLSELSSFFAIAMSCIMLSAAIIPVALGNSVDRIDGFDKGPSSFPVVALKKATFIDFDKETLLDDYAYLTCVPTAVFQNDEKMYSHPLLFFEDEYEYGADKERSLNARQGLDYFMEDWMGYCNGELDQMTLINLDKNKVDQWKAKKHIEIHGDNPYNLAGDIALQDWSYSDNAVVAVIQEKYEKPYVKTEGEVTGTLGIYDIHEESFDVDLPDIGTAGTWHDFEINDNNYKYITLHLTWPIITIDYDLQLHDTQLGMVDCAMKCYDDNAITGSDETVGSYIHNYGKWRTSVTAVPKKGIVSLETSNQQSSLSDLNLKDLTRIIQNKGNIDFKMFPGTMIDLPATPFGCRDVDLTLKWDKSNVRLGFTVLGPAETEICSSLSKEEIIKGESGESENEATVHIDLLGETREDEHYTICVFSLDDIPLSVDFTIEYDWQQNFSKTEADCLSSASNGAVLASKLNAPLLYTKPSELPEKTKDVLYNLGVEKIYLINIGDHSNKYVKDQLNEITYVVEYNTPEKVYDAIKLNVEEQTIVFSTIDSWTYWYVNERKPAGEYPEALFVGPASYIASHHVTPVIIVELHPRLSQAITYPTHFWRSPFYKQHVTVPNSGSLIFCSHQVYDFLEDYGLGKLENGLAESQLQEKIITVAGEYDIGIPWDRSFTGAALPGRFMFSPVDIAYWMSRNIFYPALIFQNPAMHGVKLWQGSESTTKGLFNTNLGFLNRLSNPMGSTLKITKPEAEEEFKYPVLQTYMTYAVNFNEQSSKFWDFQYERADGIIPFETHSPHPIDDGVALPSKSGAYYPDISETEVIPFYCEKAGYGNVFSTNFEKAVENLNRGVLIWVEDCHGGHTNGGTIGMWDSNSPYIYEENPWRSYETPIFYPGNLREFFRFIPYIKGGYQPTTLSEGLIKFHLLPKMGSTDHPDMVTLNPQLRVINKIIQGIPHVDFWGALGVMAYRTRLKHPIDTIQKGLPFFNIYDGDGKTVSSKNSGNIFLKIWPNAIDFDDALDNLHSCGLNTISCLPAGTYLSLTWMRHGMTYQIIDPWTTTDWAGIWQQMLIKLFAMGYTVGEAYERGMRACGPEYSVGQFWWDRWENVEFFGDPDLRVFVPATDYSDANHWEQDDVQPIRYNEELTINGHMPYGAKDYPHEKTPDFWEQYSLIIISVVIMVVLICIVSFVSKWKQKGNKK